ncbi:MAG: electron transfer flavoprotein beta subunit/FixA family protein [Candidatus Neomarinimicrobiota bacterium]|nr:MAG: electron transfer flavoprotein beta subunit/FixA family protein [Candidatus Neomarinimicrobiota bacterium]
MKIGVLIKQVPGSEASLRILPDHSWIDESTLEFEMNESDSYALEEALQIVEREGDGEVVAISMGPEPRTTKVLREALAKGAHRAIHIVESPPYEIDPLLVGHIIKNAIAEEHFDLLFSGLQSNDLSQGQTGLVVGELLGMNTATLVMATEMQDDHIRVKRELEGRWFQWVTIPLPAVLTIQSGINQPRYPSLKGIMGAKKKEIRIVPKETVLPEVEKTQSFGSIYIPQKEKKTVMIEGDATTVVQKLVDVFKHEIKIL